MEKGREKGIEREGEEDGEGGKLRQIERQSKRGEFENGVEHINNREGNQEERGGGREGRRKRRTGPIIEGE